MRAPRSVRTYLVGLIIGALVPPLIFGGFLVIHSAEHEQEALAMSVRNRTSIAAAAIESELNALRGRLFLLAGRLSLQTSDLSEFHTLAREEFGNMTVVLSSASGQEIVNTAVPYGEPLPDNPDPAALRYVADTQKPRIADMSLDPITHRPAVTINVPVTRDSGLAYVLSLDIISTLPRILGQLDLPAGWIAAIFDRPGHVIGRSFDPDRFIGQLARPAFLGRMKTESEGWGPGQSREGVPLFNAFAHTGFGGWVINVGIPRDVLLAPIHRTTLSLILLGCATVLIAITLAITIGRRIAAPIVGLVPLAETLGRGEPTVAGLTGLVEADVVARSLADASERLRLAAVERQAATEALRESEQAHRVLAGDLARAAEERTGLLGRMVVAQEDERKRIARELHDNLAQYLTALRLKLDTIIPPGGGGGTPARQVVGELNDLIGELGHVVNRMAFELRPVALDELGLHRAVEHYLEEWAERAHLHVDTEIALGNRELPPAVETTLFRVLQEAVTNVLRHAHASHVGVILEIKGDAIRLIVEDDGRGFPANESGAPVVAGQRLGLVGMRERLALVDGELDVESEPNHGTTLFMNIPLGQRNAAR